MSTLLFLDSFDHYSTAQGPRKWTVFEGAITSSGRTGSGLANGFGGGMASKTFGTEYTTMTAGVAYQTGAFGNWILRFANSVNSVFFNLGHVGDGRLQLSFSATGGSGTSAASTFVMNLNEWYFFEVKAQITAASPPHVIASARVNGAEILTWDYTHGSSIAGMAFNRVEPHGPGGGFSSKIDDLYVTDDEFLGDVRIGVLYPNAAGDSAAWTPNGAGANYTKVQEHPADDDTTYNSAATVGLKDLYNLDNIDPAFTGVIKGAQALWCVKKSDTGDGAVKGVWKSGGTEITQADGLNYLAPGGFYPSATDYLYNIQPKRVSLFTSTDWTKTEIDSLMLGITRTL